MSRSTELPDKGQRFNPFRMFCGIHIPNVILQHPRLKPNTKLVYGRLAQFAGENGRCFPSNMTLATELGTQKKTIINSIQNLVDEGFLEKVAPDPGEGRKTNSYFFLWHEAFADAVRVEGVKKTPPQKGGAGQPVQNVHPRSVKKTPKEIQRRDSEKETTTANRKSGGCGFSLSDEQKEFIDLKVRHMEARGRIKRSPGSLWSGLKRRAREGALDLDELPELRAWASAMKKAEEGKHLEETLAKVHKESQRAKKQANKRRILEIVSESKKSPAEWWAEMQAELKITFVRQKAFFELPLAVALRHFLDLFPDVKTDCGVETTQKPCRRRNRRCRT